MEYNEQEIENLILLLLNDQDNNKLVAFEILRERGLPERAWRALGLLHSAARNRQIIDLSGEFCEQIPPRRLSYILSETQLFQAYRSYERYNIRTNTPTLLDYQETFLRRVDEYQPLLQGRQWLLDQFQQIAEDWTMRGQTEKAIEIYELAISCKTTNADTFFDLALIYQNNLGNFERARDYYLKAIEYDPTGHVQHNNLGLVYERLGEIKKAEFHLKECLRIKPKYADALVSIAYLRWVHEQRHDDAKALYEQALQIQPDDTYCLTNYGELLSKIYKKHKEALLYLNRSLAYFPNDTYTILETADVWMRLDNRREARPLYQRVLELEPKNQRAKTALENIDPD